MKLEGRVTRESKVQFVLTGFTPDSGCRVFAFERTAEDGARIQFTVRADLDMGRRYGIRLQEFPLLCRGLLERSQEGDGNHTLIFSEAEMSVHARVCQETRNAAALKKMRTHKPPGENAGSAWRAPQMS